MPQNVTVFQDATPSDDGDSKWRKTLQPVTDYYSAEREERLSARNLEYFFCDSTTAKLATFDSRRCVQRIGPRRLAGVRWRGPPGPDTGRRDPTLRFRRQARLRRAAVTSLARWAARAAPAATRHRHTRGRPFPPVDIRWCAPSPPPRETEAGPNRRSPPQPRPSARLRSGAAGPVWRSSPVTDDPWRIPTSGIRLSILIGTHRVDSRHVGQ